MTKIIIKDNIYTEMLSISKEDGECLFHGNYWDFDRSGLGFKKLLEELGHEVKLTMEDDEF